MPSSRDVELLLEELCTTLGFCLPPEARRELGRNPPPDASEFADAAFRAEGLDPTGSDRRLYRQVEAVAERAFRRVSAPDT
jgi:hypothetical protein